MFHPDDPLTVLLLRAVLACVFLAASVLVSVMLVEGYQRARAQRLIEGALIDVEPGDRVLTQFGFAATVIEVSPTTVVLQLGPEHGDQRITAVRGAIIRSIADLDAVDGDALPHAGAPSTPGARSGHRDQR